MTDSDREDVVSPPGSIGYRSAEWDRLRADHLLAREQRPLSSARGLHHVAISVEPGRWQRLKSTLDDVGVEYDHIHGTSMYFWGSDGERLELISDPLGEMYGELVV